MTSSASEGELDRLRNGLRKGLEALLEEQGEDGFWRDFWTPAGTSDEWVTGYVAAHLANLPAPRAQRAAQRAWTALASRRSSQDGWGYNARVPPDADSTAWAILAGARLGHGSCGRVLRARRFLDRHRNSDGGLATYHTDRDIRRFLELPDAVSFAGWRASHLCVTAAAAGLEDLAPDLSPALRDTQSPDGHWDGYWWPDPTYATALATEALARGGWHAPVERACRWAASRLESPHRGRDSPEGQAPPKDLPPFALAGLLRILLAADSAQAGPPVDGLIMGCLGLLLEAQKSEGGWRPTAKLRVPPPGERDPESIARWRRWLGVTPPLRSLDETLRHTFGIYSVDQNGVFTTATVLAALARAGQRLAGHGETLENRDRAGCRPPPTPARRFQIYNVGLAKTGTSSIAAIFGAYRSGHEFMFRDTVRAIADHRRGAISTRALSAYLQDRHRRGELEMDSGSFLHQALDILVSSFPRAKFVLTVRNCETWVQSVLNMSLRYGHNAPEWMLEYGELFIGWRLDRADLASLPETLVPALPQVLEGLCRYWDESNRRALDLLPADRSLVVWTHELSRSLDRLARFAGIDAASLLPGEAHRNPAPRKLDWLTLLEERFPQALFRQRCRELTERLSTEFVRFQGT